MERDKDDMMMDFLFSITGALTAANSDFSTPEWSKDIFVPLAVALISIVGTIIVQKNTEGSQKKKQAKERIDKRLADKAALIEKQKQTIKEQEKEINRLKIAGNKQHLYIQQLFKHIVDGNPPPPPEPYEIPSFYDFQ